MYERWPQMARSGQVRQADQTGDPSFTAFALTNKFSAAESFVSRSFVRRTAAVCSQIHIAFLDLLPRFAERFREMIVDLFARVGPLLLVLLLLLLQRCMERRR